MTRFKLTLEYDGTNLLGWQRQLDGPSVQEYLEKAVFGFSGQNVEMTAAGRTDAGVHALGQVAHFDLDTKLDEYRLQQALRSVLHDQHPVYQTDRRAIAKE